MTPTQRATAYEALENLEAVAENIWQHDDGDIIAALQNLAGAISEAARTMRDALPNPDQPDLW